MKSWWQNIAAYWRFVRRRRSDVSQRVFPAFLSYLSGVLLITLPAITLYLVDPIYVSQFLEAEDDPHQFWQTITNLGKSDWLLISTGLVLILLSIFSADRFRGHHRIVWHRIYLNIHYLFTTVALSGLIVLLLKALFSRARPEFISGQGVWESKHLMFAYEYSSFPSGHSTTAGALAMGLSLMFPRVAWFLLPVGALIALSRNAVYAHFPSDSVAGFLFGVMFSYFYARYFARKRLLFCFDSNGRLKLRGEGRRHMGLFTPISTRKSS